MEEGIKNKIIDLYINKRLSGDKISQAINVSRYLVYKVIKEAGIARNNSEKSKKYFCNSNYFNKIDDEHKAYWLGFIAADGYIRSKKKYNNKALGICISNKDKNHLEKFKKDIEATHPILDFIEKQFNTTESRIIITDDNICNSLESHGIVEHKSLILHFPSKDHVPKDLINPFVRGYFDGDGSIYLSGQNSHIVSIVGTFEFLNSIKEIYNLDWKIEQKK